jgi:hypothetical protein
LFEYTPSEKVTVLLQDFWDYGNAGASAVPNNFVSIGIAPLSYAFETAPANERINHSMNHELVHVLAMDKASGSDSFFRKLFLGKVIADPDHPLSMFYSYLTCPRRYSPRWYHEGIAVFLETWMAGGIGRAMGAYDEMVFRTMVRDRSYIYDVVGLESEGTTIDFQVGVNSYLYGTRFTSYLAYRYGPEKLLNWFNKTPNSKKYFSSQFKNLYDTSLDSEWSRWIDWEQQWQQTNLDSIRLNPTTPYRPISKKALGSVSRAYYDASNRKLYVAIRYPGQVAHISAIDIDDGRIKKICDVIGAAGYYVTSLAFDESAGSLFFTTGNKDWRDLNVVSVETGKSKILLKDVRTGDLAFNKSDRSLWGVRHHNGISTLVRMPHPYDEWNTIYSFPYGKDIYDIDISPDGKMLTGALAEISGRQSLILMEVENLLKDDISYDTIFDFDVSNPANFVFSSDGKYLYGSSYYNGVSNIYRYDFGDEEMEIVSNCESGFFRPVPISNDSLIVFRYTGKGFVPVMIPKQSPESVNAIRFLGNEIVEKHPVVQNWMLGSPASIDIESLTTYSGSYHPLRKMKIMSAYPIVEGYKDYAALGMRIEFSDRLGLAGFDLTASYSPHSDLPESEKIHLGFNFHYWQWKIHAAYNTSNFYDLFGPTKTSRKGYSYGLEYNKTILYDEPKSMDFNVGFNGYGDLERLPDFQNVEATFDKLLALKMGLDYKFLRKSLGAVDDEKGVRWEIVSHNNYVNSKIFPRVYANLDLGIPLPINHSSIWLRSSAGHSFGEREDPFANFYFGGFGNNWVDHLTEKRYREYYSFPGVEINAIGGANYGKLTAEWILPPIRFRRFGFTSLYFRWARIALFSSGIMTNMDDKGSKRSLLNVGGQIDFRLVTFSLLKSTLSFGYALAFEENQRISKEFMISFKIL